MGMLDGKAVIITGSGRGLGRAYALAAAAAGADVVVNDLDPEPADEVAAAIAAAGGRAVSQAGSVSDWDEAGTLIARCISEFGKVDGLVNNAGLFRVLSPEDEDPAAMRRDVEANVLGTLYAGTHAMRAMVGQGSGTIVNVTSGSHLGISRQGTYGATKGAVASVTYSWALDMVRHGVRVNGMSPVALTRMAHDVPSKMDLSALPEPAAIAPLAVFMLSDGAAFTGQIVRLDGATLNLLRQPHYDPALGVTQDSWTAEQIQEAWTARLSRHVVESGMAAYRD